MKVFFTASYKGKTQYQKYYDLIVKAIEENNVELISPEKGNYKEILMKEDLKRSLTDQEEHYLAIKKGIEWADIVIIEISTQDFQLGHEATLAIQNKKHVLCLSLYENYSDKIINRFFDGVRYTKYNIKTIINEFISKNKKELLSERFNCFLSKSQINFLEVQSKKLGINMSEYLRDLIDKSKIND